MGDNENYNNMLARLYWHVAGFMAGLLCCALITMFCIHSCWNREPVKVDVDTLVIHDTIRHDSLIPVKEEIVRYVKKPVHDTVFMDKEIFVNADSEIVIPITQKTYTDDSTFRAWVSGYDVALDSIETYRRTVVITKRERQRWHIGLQGGVYLTPKGFQPGIGFGATYLFDIDEIFPP